MRIPLPEVMDHQTAEPGSLSISSDGVISRSCVSGYCLNGTNYSGFIDAGKTIMVATSGASTDTEDAVVYVFTKKGASYSMADLAGTWESNSFVSGPGAPWWERGTITIKPTGKFALFNYKITVAEMTSSGGVSR